MMSVSTASAGALEAGECYFSSLALRLGNFFLPLFLFYFPHPPLSPLAAFAGFFASSLRGDLDTMWRQAGRIEKIQHTHIEIVPPPSSKFKYVLTFEL